MCSFSEAGERDRSWIEEKRGEEEADIPLRKGFGRGVRRFEIGGAGALLGRSKTWSVISRRNHDPFYLC